MCQCAGARLLGELECSGVGTPIHADHVKSIAQLQHNIEQSNKVLLAQLRPDSEGEGMLKITREAASKGWMTQPVPIDEADIQHVLSNPRFAVEQARYELIAS